MLSIDEARRIAVERSIPEPNTGCWLWLGSVNIGGYAKVRVGGSEVQVSRALLGLAKGDPARALHRCDTGLCVNPEHLFVGTQSDNMHDMIAKGRDRSWNRGKTHCVNGHEFTAENTRIRQKRSGGTQRDCRQCSAERQQRHRAHRILV